MQIFPLKKVKVIVSDFHLGKGRRLSDGSQNLLEDFRSDSQFIEFLSYYRHGSYKRCDLELIINGDFFNLLQVDYRDEFTDFITEADSLHKLMSIIRGHQKLFDQLGEFSRESHHSVTFMLGNHDPGLLWPGVQKALKDILGGEVRFIMEAYEGEGTHVEHGNQFLADNAYDPNQYFLTENLPEPIIHLPFGSFLVVHYLNQIKKERPYIDKVYPFGLYFRWALFHDTLFFFKALFSLILWFFRLTLSRSPAINISWSKSIEILAETTVHPKLHKEAKRLLMAREDIKIVVFGHTHQHQHRIFAPGKEYFNTGTWNEKISLEVGTLGRVLRLTFVHIDYDKGGVPHGSLKEWRGHRDVVEDLTF